MLLPVDPFAVVFDAGGPEMFPAKADRTEILEEAHAGHSRARIPRGRGAFLKGCFFLKIDGRSCSASVYPGPPWPTLSRRGQPRSALGRLGQTTIRFEAAWRSPSGSMCPGLIRQGIGIISVMRRVGPTECKQTILNLVNQGPSGLARLRELLPVIFDSHQIFTREAQARLLRECSLTPVMQTAPFHQVLCVESQQTTASSQPERPRRRRERRALETSRPS